MHDDAPFYARTESRLIDAPNRFLCAATDRGKSRQKNEDRVYFVPEASVTVADGVGGAPTGEVASELAATVSCHYLAEAIRLGCVSNGPMQP